MGAVVLLDPGHGRGLLGLQGVDPGGRVFRRVLGRGVTAPVLTVVLLGGLIKVPSPVLPLLAGNRRRSRR